MNRRLKSLAQKAFTLWVLVLQVAAAFAVTLAISGGDAEHPLLKRAAEIHGILTEVEAYAYKYPKSLLFEPFGNRTFRSSDIESARAKLRELAKLIEEESLKLKATSSVETLTIIAKASQHFLLMQGQMVQLYARAAHLPKEDPLDPEGKRDGMTKEEKEADDGFFSDRRKKERSLWLNSLLGEEKSDLTQKAAQESNKGRIPTIRVNDRYTFKDVEIPLRLKKNVGTVVLYLAEESGLQLNSKHVANGLDPLERVEFTITNEQTQFAEMLAISRAANQWEPSIIWRRMTDNWNQLPEGKSSPAAVGAAAFSTFSFDSPVHYARFLQFQALKETLTNRWALSRMADTPFADVPLNSCGNGIISFQPEGQSMQKTDAYKELENFDRQTAIMQSENEIVEAAGSVLFGNAAQYSATFKKVAYNDKAVKEDQTGLMQYFEENLQKFGPQFVALEQDTWKKAAVSFVRVSTFTGDSLMPKDNAARLAHLIAMTKAKIAASNILAVIERNVNVEVAPAPVAVSEVAPEPVTTDSPSNLIGGDNGGNTAESTPAVVAPVITAQASKKKSGYSAAEHYDATLAALKPEMERLEKALYPKLLAVFVRIEDKGMAPPARQARFEKKIEDTYAVLKKAAIAQREFEKLSADLKWPRVRQAGPVPPGYVSTIDDPVTLKTYFQNMMATQYSKDPEHQALRKLLKDPKIEKLFDAYFIAVGKHFIENVKIAKAEHDKKVADYQKAAAGSYVRQLTPAKTAANAFQPNSFLDPMVTYYAPPKGLNVGAFEVPKTYLYFSAKRVMEKMLKPYEKLKTSTFSINSTDKADIPTALRWLSVILHVTPEDQTIHNRNFTRTDKEYKTALETMVIQAAYQAPLLKVRMKFKGGEGAYLKTEIQGKADSVNEIGVNVLWDKGNSELIDIKNRSLIENAATFAVHPKTKGVFEKRLKLIIRQSLISAQRQNVGLLEEFCKADTLHYKDDDSFRKLFRTVTSFRGLLSASNPEIAKLDAAMVKEVRTGNEVFYEDYLTPVMKVVGYISYVYLAVITGGWLLGALPAVMAFLQGAAVATLMAAMAVPIGTNLAYSMYFTLYEKPQQLKFQAQVAGTQAGAVNLDGGEMALKTQALVNWEQHLGERTASDIAAVTRLVTAPLDILFLRGTITNLPMLVKTLRNNPSWFGVRGMVNSGAPLKMVKPKSSEELFTGPSTTKINPTSKIPQPLVSDQLGALASAKNAAILDEAAFQALKKNLGEEMRTTQTSSQIADYLPAYIREGAKAAKTESELFSSASKMEFWEKIATNPKSAAIGRFPKSAQEALENGTILDWAKTTLPTLAPQFEKQAASFKALSENLEHLGTKTSTAFEGGAVLATESRGELWAKALDKNEIYALRSLVNKEGILSYHVPQLSTARGDAFNATLNRTKDIIAKFSPDFQTQLKPPANESFGLYWGKPGENLSPLDDVKNYSVWLEAYRPSMPVH